MCFHLINFKYIALWTFLNRLYYLIFLLVYLSKYFYFGFVLINICFLSK